MEFEFVQRQSFHQYIHLKNKMKPNKTHMAKSLYQKHWYGNFVGFVYLCVCVGTCCNLFWLSLIY